MRLSVIATGVFVIFYQFFVWGAPGGSKCYQTVTCRVLTKDITMVYNFSPKSTFPGFARVLRSWHISPYIYIKDITKDFKKSLKLMYMFVWLKRHYDPKYIFPRIWTIWLSRCIVIYRSICLCLYRGYCLYFIQYPRKAGGQRPGYPVDHTWFPPI
jgi:hypothetical protein